MGDANQQRHLLYCTDPPTVSNQRVIRALFIRHNMLVSFISLLSGQITCAHRHSSVNMEMHLAWVGTWHTVIPSHGWGETTHFTLFNMATSLSIIKAAYRSRCLRISILFTEQRDYVLLLIRCYIMWPIGFFLILPALRGDWCISTLCHTSKPWQVFIRKWFPPCSEHPRLRPSDGCEGEWNLPVGSFSTHSESCSVDVRLKDAKWVFSLSSSGL